MKMTFKAHEEDIPISHRKKIVIEYIGVFPKWIRTFIEFSEFRESDKSLKYELGSI